MSPHLVDGHKNDAPPLTFWDESDKLQNAIAFELEVFLPRAAEYFVDLPL
jgi:hypothetical protein